MNLTDSPPHYFSYIFFFYTSFPGKDERMIYLGSLLFFDLSFFLSSDKEQGVVWILQVISEEREKVQVAFGCRVKFSGAWVEVLDNFVVIAVCCFFLVFLGDSRCSFFLFIFTPSFGGSRRGDINEIFLSFLLRFVRWFYRSFVLLWMWSFW